MRRFCARLLGVILLVMPAYAFADNNRLPQTYVSDDESLVLHYPKGWVIQADQPGLVVVATDESLFRITTDTVSSGQAAVAMLFSTADDAYLRAYFSGDDATAVLENIIERLFNSAIDPNVELSAPESGLFADYPATRVEGRFNGNHVLLIVADRGAGVFSLMIGLATESEFAKYAPKLLAIAESVYYHPPAS